KLPESLRLVIIGGEKALPERIAEWQQNAGPNVCLINTYGPTEATIVATTCNLDEAARSRTDFEDVPIGRPLDRVEAYVLDSCLQPSPIGVPGELYLGGKHLARGYLSRPDVTAERFIPHPFTHQAGARLYRTGDIVRYMSDRQLYFVGRADDQVKIRGHRIEPGEIEAALCQYELVRQAVVIATEDESGEKRLVAYVASEGALAAGQLRAHLKAHLRKYMLRGAFICLPQFPLTPSGKIDRRNLPAPEQGRLDLGNEYVAPKTETEEVLCG